MCPNKVNMIVVQNNEKNGDYYEHPSLSHFIDEHYLQEKWWKERLFFKIQSINIIYPNVENVIIAPITKRIEIIMTIQVCFISHMNLKIRKMVERKAFLAKSKLSISCTPMWRI